MGIADVRLKWSDFQLGVEEVAVELSSKEGERLYTVIKTTTINTHSSCNGYRVDILQRLGLDNIPELWRTILGLAFIISLSLLIVYFVVKIMEFIVSKYYRIRFKIIFPKVMKNLRSEEIAVVALLYRSPNYTSRLPYTDGVTIRLKSKKIIQLTSSNNLAYGEDLVMPFTITPIAQDYIDKHPELIGDFSKPELESMYKRYNNPFY